MDEVQFSKITAKIKSKIAFLEKEMRDLWEMADELDKNCKKSYEDIPGVTGTFNGIGMVASDGKVYEVPVNYAAKSCLVYGDELKMIEEEGRTLFKQINKVPRKRLSGVLSKKDGQWFALTQDGSYKIPDKAAEYYGAKVSDKVTVIVPSDIANVQYAALEKPLKEDIKPAAPMTTQAVGFTYTPTSPKVESPIVTATNSSHKDAKAKQSDKPATGQKNRSKTKKYPKVAVTPKTPIPSTHPATPSTVTSAGVIGSADLAKPSLGSTSKPITTPQSDIILQPSSRNQPTISSTIKPEPTTTTQSASIPLPNISTSPTTPKPPLNAPKPPANPSRVLDDDDLR